MLGLFLSGGANAQEQRSNTVWDGFSGFLQPDWERDFSLTLGVKVWVNEWTRDSFPGRGLRAPDLSPLGVPNTEDIIEAGFSSQRPLTQTSEDVKPTPIPQLSIRYKWLLLSGSYYPETEFEYRTTTDTVTINQQLVDLSGNVLATSPTTQGTFFDTTTAEREEWDAGFGILVLPNVAILGGYKEINQDVQDVFTLDVVEDGVPVPGLTGQPAGMSSQKVEIKGPTIGIAGSVPIAHGFGLYGSYAHGFMDVDITDTFAGGTPIEGEADADYDVAELGFTYTHGTKEFIPIAPLSAATVYAGYRWQHIETDFSDQPNTEDRTDTTRGFVAGVNLTF